MTTQETDVNRRILVIDDNHAIREDLRKILGCEVASHQLAAKEETLCGAVQTRKRSRDFELIFADRGQRGLALVQHALRQNCPFAMAFVDIRSPSEREGIETIEQLWKEDSDLQVVLCTAYSDQEWEQVLQRLGYSENLVVLRKPVDRIEVQQLADSFTAKWNLARQANRRLESLVRAEVALQDALAETESLVTAISSVLIGLNDKDCVFRWNSAAEQAFGIPAEEILGHSIQETEIQWDWDFVMKSMQDCRKQLHPLRIPEFRYLDKTGTERTLGMTLSPILRETDSRPGILILGKDITQQQKLEAQLTLAQKMQSIGKLAAGVAHELNTPVQYIAENLRFLKEGFHDLRRLLELYRQPFRQAQGARIDQHTRTKVRQIRKEIDLEYLLKEIPIVLAQSLEGTDRVAEIIRTMNEFSHPGTNEKIPADLHQTLQSAMTLSSKEWENVAEVVTDFEKELPLLHCIPHQLIQVWINLLINAAQAIEGVVSENSRNKGTITISTQEDNEWAEVRISDTGPGIPESIQSHVFDLFFTTKEVGKGTGQGLAIAHAIIVQNHGGDFMFESNPSGGTTFIARLPLELRGMQEVGVGG